MALRAALLCSALGLLGLRGAFVAPRAPMSPGASEAWEVAAGSRAQASMDAPEAGEPGHLNIYIYISNLYNSICM